MGESVPIWCSAVSGWIFEEGLVTWPRGGIADPDGLGPSVERRARAIRVAATNIRGINSGG